LPGPLKLRPAVLRTQDASVVGAFGPTVPVQASAWAVSFAGVSAAGASREVPAPAAAGAFVD